MQYVKRLERQLVATRRTSERLLSAFQSPEQWTFQVHPAANHALWFVGHMATTDNFFVSLLDPEKVRDLPEFTRAFAMGSQPVNDPSAYPPIDELRRRMHERREVLLGILAKMSDEQLEQPLPRETPDFLTDVASVFETAICHERLHGGQLSVVRRALGHPPLSDVPDEHDGPID